MSRIARELLRIKMKLKIDTTGSEEIVIYIGDKKFEDKAREKSSQKLLPFIVSKLKSEGKKFSDITGIEVETGPGSFTGIRVGVSVAQALGWALKIPVNGKDLTKGDIINITYE